MTIIALIVHRIFQLVILVVVVQAILSFFMSPYDPVRGVIDRLVNPLLQPIRRYIKPVGSFDFSPLVLVVILQLLDWLIQRLLSSLAF